MPRDLRAHENRRRVQARRDAALARTELGQPTSPRVSAVGPVSMAVKDRVASDDLLIEAYLRQKREAR